jgi:hypothetical protein
MARMKSGTSTQNFAADVKSKHFPIPKLSKKVPKVDRKKPAEIPANKPRGKIK